MHNHSINTVEQAVAFYNSDAFNLQTRNPIHLESTEVIAIASWLRTINVLLNIQMATDFLDKALSTTSTKDFSKLVKRATYETQDAYEVLYGVNYNLFLDAAKLLERAYKLEKNTGSKDIDKVIKAKKLLTKAKASIITP